MSVFTLQIGPNGPELNALVGVSAGRESALQSAGQPVPQLQQIRALVDTGASCTCVDPSVLQALQLTPTGQVTVNTPSTGAQPHTANQYDVALIIPGASPAHPFFVANTVAVVEAQLLPQQGFHALIGRDILRHCLLVYNGPLTQFSLAY
jgi:hypothetical protein